MQKGRVDQNKLTIAYHTAPFQKDRLYDGPENDEDNVLIGMDVNLSPDGNQRYIWLQVNHLMNGGGFVRGIAYCDKDLDKSEAAPDQLRGAAIKMLTAYDIPFTTDQLDTIFAQDGYLETDKISEISGRSLQLADQQKQFSQLTTSDLHPHVLSVLKARIIGMSTQELIDEARIDFGGREFELAMAQNSLNKSDDSFRLPLIDLSIWQADKAMSRDTTAQARHLLENGVTVAQILGMATGAELPAESDADRHRLD